ncbi:MAG: insulinase family protein [Sedimentisphaerales bacterium]|nr:insulinase family protein [Sedimentisphaerales bacterium]
MANNNNVLIEPLANGMTLVGVKMAEVSSAAFSLMVRCGAAYDPPDRLGAATVLAELVFKGAGEFDNRTLSDRLDSLGLQRQENIGTSHTIFSGALLGDNLYEALGLYADVLQRPHLNETDFHTSRALALQSLASMEDDPRQKIGLLTHTAYLPAPWSHPSPGMFEHLQTLSLDETRKQFQQFFSPRSAILAVAGKVDFDQLRRTVQNAFGDWTGSEAPSLNFAEVPAKSVHQTNQGAQVHIGLMYPSVGYNDVSFFSGLAAVGVLSGGMGSRLFTEVREKRGLCYSVSVGHQVIGPTGAVQGYVGSSPDKAQEALDVTVGELRSLADGIAPEELERAKVGLRASLIMQGEATTARAAAAARDYYHLGRVRSLDEFEAAINAISLDDVVAFAQEHRPEPMTVATIGPKQLQIP